MPATSKLSNNHADTRTEGGLRSPVTGNVVLTPCGRQTPVQIMLRVPAASTRPTASPPAQNVHHSSANSKVSSIAALQLPNVCHARATTGCPTRCRCRCQPRSESSAHAAAAGPVGRDANLCHAVCKGGQHRSIMVVVPTAARSAA